MDRLPDLYDDTVLLDLGSLPDTSQDFVSFLFRVRDTFGLDDVAYAGLNPINGTVFGHVTYDEGWKSHYASEGFHRIDPTLHKARRSVAPVDWSRLERDESFERVFRDAHDFGIPDQGLTIPVRGPFGDIGGLSVTSSLPGTEWTRLRNEIIGNLQSVAVHMHDMVIRSDSLSNLLKTPTLSGRELEVLQWISAGKSQQDIADILSISNRTVEVHLRSARHKLFALTTAQAVGRAISMGLIYPG